MVFKQSGRLDDALIRAIEQDGTFAGQIDDCGIGRAFACCREQRRYFRRRSSGASWVQAIAIAWPSAAAARTRSSSARQSSRPGSTSAPRQARSTAEPSSGIVSSQEQTRIFRGRSAIYYPYRFSRWCPAEELKHSPNAARHAGPLWAMWLYVKRGENNSEVQCRW